MVSRQDISRCYDQLFLRFFILNMADDLRVSARLNPFILPFSSSLLLLLVEPRLWLRCKKGGKKYWQKTIQGDFAGFDPNCVQLKFDVPHVTLRLCKVCGHRMAHRKWRETKLHPDTAGPGSMLGWCLISFNFLWAILCPQAVQCSCSGWPTGNGDKLSNSPACCLSQLCLAAA